MTFFKMQEGSLRGFARPQALTCQGRRRSAAAAHAKDPARPVTHPLFVRRGFGVKTRKFLNFYVARPKSRPRGLYLIIRLAQCHFFQT